jgi:LysM repeat protein
MPDQGEPADARSVVYLVAPGDDLNRIAQHFDTQVEALIYANQLSSPVVLHVGQQLTIPVLPVEQTLAPADPRRGLAMAENRADDLAALGVGWFYIWDWCSNPGCVPMVYWMELPPACPALLLVGNEPNAIRPYGGPISPTVAAARVRQIEFTCPQTRLIVGNVSADDWAPSGGWGSGQNWILAFLDAYKRRSGHAFHQTLGVHCYAQTEAAYCLGRLAELRGTYAGPMWVTEFGLLSGAPDAFDSLLRYAAANFERFAAYTNRQPHTSQGWELTTGVELVGSNGMLTPIGQVYADWPLPANSRMH